MHVLVMSRRFNFYVEQYNLQIFLVWISARVCQYSLPVKPLTTTNDFLNTMSTYDSQLDMHIETNQTYKPLFYHNFLVYIKKCFPYAICKNYFLVLFLPS